MAQEKELLLEEAQQQAIATNKHIMIVFSGSDWCAPCIKLARTILDTETFTAYADANYIRMTADFPRKKKNQLPPAIQLRNKQLAERYNKSGGFPLVVLIDATGKKYGEMGYKKTSPAAYIQLLEALHP